MSTARDVPQGKPAQSPWSFRIATVAGIPIRVHFTFLLFFVWIAVNSNSVGWPLLVLTLFGCVVLHELGHALTAQHFNVQTRDITLYPIGGVAMLQGRPTPRQELWIALAGPAVNLVIAALLAPVVIATTGHLPNLAVLADKGTFAGSVMMLNLVLAAFNLVPAFPMDGGRVLRAALALAMPEAKATQIAASIGQGLAIALVIWGLIRPEILLVLIGFFVFIGAGQEANASLTRSFLAGHTLRDAMMTNFRTVEHGMTLEDAAKLLLAGPQHDFPVVIGEEVAGILTRNAIARGLATAGPSAYIAEIMDRSPQTAGPDMPLEEAMELFQRNESAPILVMEETKLVGMITTENLSEFIMLQAARVQSGRIP